jgi:uncharacterized Zn finger protein (UPF0148 family)
VTVKDCPKCGLPLIQRDNGDVWCSVYGTHKGTVGRRTTRAERARIDAALVKAAAA